MVVQDVIVEYAAGAVSGKPQSRQIVVDERTSCISDKHKKDHIFFITDAKAR